MTPQVGSCRSILVRVAQEFDLTVSELLSARQERRVVLPRQVAMYLCRRLTPYSYAQIGRAVGKLDHTTVMHGIRAVEERMAVMPFHAKQVARLEADLRQQQGDGVEAAIGELGDTYAAEIRELARRAVARDPAATAQAVISALRSIVAACLLVTYAAPARAQVMHPVCESRDMMVTALQRKFGEAPVGVGLSSDGLLVELLRSADGGSWTILVNDPSGVTCAVSTGTDWQDLPPPPKGDPS